MSLGDYNRGYQAGSSGWYTGLPSSFAEAMGRAAAEADRQRWQRPMSSPSGGYTGGGSDGLGVRGLLVGVGLMGGVLGWIAKGTILGAAVGAVAAAGAVGALILMVAAVCFAFVGLGRLLGLAFGGLPAIRLALLGAASGLASRAVVSGIDVSSDAAALADAATLADAAVGAVACILLGACFQALLSPLRLLVPRG